MTKLLGALVGSQISNNNLVSTRFSQGTDNILVRDRVLTAGNLIGDTVSLALLKSTAFISPSSKLWWQAFGAGCTLSIGDVNHTATLTSALDVSAAGAGDLMVLFNASKMGKQLWDLLGYSTDPGGTLELLATFAGANPANVSMAWAISGQNS